MGRNQHLVRSLLAIQEEGGVTGRDGTRIWPEVILVGRDEGRLRRLATEHGIERWSTNLQRVLEQPDWEVYFDAQTTPLRAESVLMAIEAKKHVYCEKPSAGDLVSALQLAAAAAAAGVKNGVVQDKLFLPGLMKLRGLIDGGFFGRILSVRGEFGYWVFTGPHPPGQRPSWNYRSEDGGGIVSDMFCHWRYVLDNLFAPVQSVYAKIARHIPERFDESGLPYHATADDAAYAIFTLRDEIVAQINSSWCTRVDRDELFELHVDGTLGSAVAGLRECRVQPAVATPVAVWNPDIPNPIRFRDGWMRVPDNTRVDNAFKAQWEMFLRHVVDDDPFPWSLLEGAKGVQLAELALESDRERRVVDVPPLNL
ncbi:MAG: oxidoreductase [Nitrospiraceae bacterium]|nr:MAG: oxidoreductase [Nitrospiraceae bacterium]